MYNNFNEEQLTAIEELKETIFDIAYNNPKDDFICTECISTIHKLLAILIQLTGNEDKDFANEIYGIIGA